MMRKLNALMMAGSLVFAFGLVGCSEESGMSSKTEVTGPGGTTTVEKNVEVEKSGENPPAVPTTPATP